MTTTTSNTNKKHIVIIEDDANVSVCFQLILEQNFKLSFFTTAEEALQYVRQNSTLIDLIILDYRLPGMYGAEFLSLIRRDENTKHLKVILQTADNLDLLDCISKADCYLAKPWAKQKMLDAIKHLLGE